MVMKQQVRLYSMWLALVTLSVYAADTDSKGKEATRKTPLHLKWLEKEAENDKQSSPRAEENEINKASMFHLDAEKHLTKEILSLNERIKKLQAKKSDESTKDEGTDKDEGTESLYDEEIKRLTDERNATQKKLGLPKAICINLIPLPERTVKDSRRRSAPENCFNGPTRLGAVRTVVGSSGTRQASSGSMSDSLPRRKSLDSPRGLLENKPESF